MEEKRIAAEESPCEADNPSDVMTRMGNYLGSWLGLGSVPEHEGPGDLMSRQNLLSMTVLLPNPALVFLVIFSFTGHVRRAKLHCLHARQGYSCPDSSQALEQG